MDAATLKDNRVYSLVVLYDMHTTFFSKVLDGINDKDIHNRLNTKANHIAWLTGSLVEQRFDLARIFGANEKQTADDLFKDNKGIQDNVAYPSLEQFKNDWQKITPVLRDLIVNREQQDLDKIIDMGEFKMSAFELLSFVIYREANIIGQIALWRRLLNYPAMNYM